MIAVKSCWTSKLLPACVPVQTSALFSSFDEGGWIDLLNAAIMAQPVVISCSWGDNEDDTNWSGGAIAAIDERLNAARLLGITICVSSGDDGSGDEENDGRAHVDFPSSSPNTLAVGGTMLTTREAVRKRSAGVGSGVPAAKPAGRRDRRRREYDVSAPRMADGQGGIAQPGINRRASGARHLGHCGRSVLHHHRSGQ